MFKFLSRCALVAASVFSFNQNLYALSAPPVPPIEAKAYLLLDHDSGKVLASDKADDRLEPASLTKVMTLYIVLEELKSGKIRLTDNVRISEKAWRAEGSRTFVEVGKTIPLEILVKGLIVQSGNDATIALAEHVAGSEEVFASMMNQTAQKLGMRSTHFMNSTGLPDPNHYTTVSDLATLTRALIRNHPEHYNWHSIKEFTYNGITQHNRNKLLWLNPLVDGVKTGHTEAAGYCLIASAKQGEMRLISIVMGTKDENTRAAESQKLLGHGFRFFETRRIYSSGKVLATAKVWKGDKNQVELGISSPMYLTIPREQFANLKPEVRVNPQLIAPITQGNGYGTLTVTVNGEKVAEQPLVALQGVPEGGFIGRMIDTLKLKME